MENIFKPITLTWWQVGIVKTAVLAFAFIVAHYWPVVTEWVGFWAVLFVICALYAMKLRFAKR